MRRKFRRALGAFLITLVLLICYISSFYIVRHKITFTAGVPVDFSGRSVTTVYYFSKGKKLNWCLFWLYYPLHWHSPTSLHEFNSSPPPYVLYFADTTILKQAGAAGF
jgi:hypothetical protein